MKPIILPIKNAAQQWLYHFVFSRQTPDELLEKPKKRVRRHSAFFEMP